MSTERRGLKHKEHLRPDVSVGYRSIASEKHPYRNEDGFFILDQDAFGVFDGVGASSEAQNASSKAAAMVKEDLEEWRKKLSEKIWGFHQGYTTISLSYQTEDAIHKSLVNASEKLHSSDGGQTTASVVYLVLDERPKYRVAVIGNVGDSRVYVVDEKAKIIEVTLDDGLLKPNMPTQRIDKNERKKIYDKQRKLSEATKKTSLQDRNVITQALGSSIATRPSIQTVNLALGDRVIIVSDGVSDNLTESEILKILKAEKISQSAATRLVNEALTRSRDEKHARSKPDDMTAIVVAIIG